MQISGREVTAACRCLICLSMRSLHEWRKGPGIWRAPSKQNDDKKGWVAMHMHVLLSALPLS